MVYTCDYVPEDERATLRDGFDIFRNQYFKKIPFLTQQGPQFPFDQFPIVSDFPKIMRSALVDNLLRCGAFNFIDAVKVIPSYDIEWAEEELLPPRLEGYIHEGIHMQTFDALLQSFEESVPNMYEDKFLITEEDEEHPHALTNVFLSNIGEFLFMPLQLFKDEHGPITNRPLTGKKRKSSESVVRPQGATPQLRSESVVRPQGATPQPAWASVFVMPMRGNSGKEGPGDGAFFKAFSKALKKYSEENVPAEKKKIGALLVTLFHDKDAGKKIPEVVLLWLGKLVNTKFADDQTLKFAAFNLAKSWVPIPKNPEPKKPDEIEKTSSAGAVEPVPRGIGACVIGGGGTREPKGTVTQPANTTTSVSGNGTQNLFTELNQTELNKKKILKEIEKFQGDKAVEGEVLQAYYNKIFNIVPETASDQQKSDEPDYKTLYDVLMCRMCETIADEADEKTGSVSVLLLLKKLKRAFVASRFDDKFKELNDKYEEYKKA